MIWISCRTPFLVFTSIGKFLLQLAYEMTSLCHANIPLSITVYSFVFLARPMDSAHQFLNPNISGRSKNHGDDQVATKHSVRCSLQTSGWTNWQLLEPISVVVVCSKEHA
jgi:hypothetical protein